MYALANPNTESIRQLMVSIWMCCGNIFPIPEIERNKNNIIKVMLFLERRSTIYFGQITIHCKLRQSFDQRLKVSLSTSTNTHHQTRISQSRSEIVCASDLILRNVLYIGFACEMENLHDFECFGFSCDQLYRQPFSFSDTHG